MAKFAIDLKSGDIKREGDLIVGIDLGTTNSLVAFMQDGKAVAVKGQDGQNALVPSIIHFDEHGTVTVGDEARALLIAAPQNTIYSVKRLMGKSYRDIHQIEGYFGYHIIDDDPDSLVKIRVNDKYYNPIELSAEILKALKRRIELALGEAISKAVITVPAYFNDAQRQATRDAGKLAGLDVLRIVNEPTAASLAYGIGLDPSKTETVAVYDLGGGTFDISILRIQDGIFEVLATNGDTFLGGDDMDRAIIDFWLKRAGEGQHDRERSQALRLEAEKAKKALSTADVYTGSLESIECSITRETFENLIQPLVDKTLECCKQAVADSGYALKDIDEVIMVGGSTRVPLVRKSVAHFFGKPVFDRLNPDEVVALGAAIQADILAGNQKDLLLLDITPLSLGIETMGGLMDVIIPRNSKVPTRVGRRYTTSVDGQRNLKIAVFQGERDLVANNRKLGEFTLQGIPPMPAGLPKIEIKFLLDADGILQVRALEERSQVEQSIEVRPQYGISEEEMGRMLIESIRYAQQDMLARGVLEAKNEGNMIVLSAEKFLQQHAAILSLSELEKTRELTEKLKMAMEGQDKDAINRAIEQLNTYTAPLAHRAMDKTIAEAMAGRKIEAP
jgi:molecular chaperone HscA